MYHQVYHHKAIRAAECLIRAIFQRVGELVRNGVSPSPMPTALRAAALGERATLGEYLELDDGLLMTCFSMWQKGGDPLLCDLTRRLDLRVLPKTVPLPEHSEEGAHATWAEALHRAREIATRRGLRADLLVSLDIAEDTPYPEADGVADDVDGVWVALRHKPLQRLGEVSFLLRALRNERIARPRLIFPEEIRDEVVAAVEGVLA